jgi:cell division protease FtsH
MKKYVMNTLLWGVVLIGALLIFNRFNSTPPVDQSLAYSTFIEKVKLRQIDRVEIMGHLIRVKR